MRMSHKARLWCVYQGGSFWRCLCCLTVFTSCLGPTAVLGCSNCTETLTGLLGQFSSPCFPKDYLPNLNCRWTILAPPGFIVQLTFHDFELEEAQGCPYDFVSIETGAEKIKFCGVTAKGHTLNSTRNEMIVEFKTDFSIQKNGFSATYRRVAVSLRNQKVVVDKSSQRQAVSVSPLVSIPDLEQFTVCLEAKSSTVKKNWVLFSYLDSNNLTLIDFRSTGHNILLEISNVECDVSDIWADDSSDKDDSSDEDDSSGEVFTGAWRQLCITWDGASGDIITQTQNRHQLNHCPDSKGKGITGKGFLTLAPKQQDASKSFSGQLYNFRLWNFTMPGQSLVDLPCEEVGSVVDWENSFWDIPVSMLEADSALSCATALPTPPTVRPTCSSLGSGCQATSPANSNTLTTNMHTTNSVDPSTNGTNAPLTEVTTHGSRETTDLRQRNNTVSQNTTCNCSNSEGGVFYRTQFMLYSQSSGSTDIGELEQKVSAWLTRSFQNWNYTVYVETVRIFESNTTSTHQISSRSIEDKRSVLSYICKAILYYNITKNIYLEERVVQERLINTSKAIGSNLSIASINVQPIVNCSLDENPAQYKWTDTRPRVTLVLPCLTNPGQYASRKCLLNTQNYTSYWEPPDLTNCSIGPSSNTSDFPLVSADNAADVANQLLDFTADKNLTREQVDKLVETLNQIVIVSEINSSLASTVLTVLSNILSSSDNALTTSSQVALRTVDTLTAKMIFSGPSVSITTPNLAIGISAIDSQTYNGTSFSVGSQDGESELEVSLDKKPRKDTLAEIELSPGVFERLTEEEISEVSRTQFAFFSRTGLFQDPRGFSLQSFVVASSVGNITISNLSEPVRIRIKHRNPEEKFKPLCAFWDLTLNNGSGGWSTHGCYADPRSSVSETICLCNHLTHFGVLLDISGTAQQIDAVNTKILTFITHIGCGISAIFSATTLLTYVAFEKLRRDYPSKILMNLSTSLFFLNFTFLIDGWLASFDIAGLCRAVAALLHFFLLVTFTWMGLEAVHMYIALVKVFNTYIRKYMLKFCIIGWGLPALVVVIVLAIDRRFYGMSLYGKDAADSGASEFCWIDNRVVFYVTCVCYFAVLFLMNISMFIVVLIQICGRNGKKTNRNLREEILRNLRSVTSLTFLLGMTWGFAFFAWGPVNLSFMYLFAIFNSLQGFFIFVFHCALKENVQKQWRRYLCCGRFRLPENSDWSRTITNNTKKVSSENLGKSLSSSSIAPTPLAGAASSSPARASSKAAPRVVSLQL
ncbi:adhesion G-protein coupled receptor G6 [Pristis pectinata]|uniref:adhesion G-protein coupled receptor G6 n=1 Tax=Pristis pectinata TaxID=685728 RepID=UPI00223CE0F7|nr:adhesion G-protein coupled receptor G6 [Pristis pectinata]